MPIYETAPVSENGEVRLKRWSLRQVDTGERFFVGFDVEMRYGRMSTPIQSFDPRTRIGFTASGRRYVLLGAAGIDTDGEYVWNRVVAVRNVGSWRDVTHEVCPDWRNPVPEAERCSDGTVPGTGDGRSDDKAGSAEG